MNPVFKNPELNALTHMPFILNAQGEDLLIYSKRIGKLWLPHWTLWNDEGDGEHRITLSGYTGGACNPCARYVNGMLEVSFITEGKDGYQLDLFKGHTLDSLTRKTPAIRQGVWSGFVYGGMIASTLAHTFSITREGVSKDYLCDVDMIWRLVAHPQDANKIIISAEKDDVYLTQIFDLETGQCQGIGSFYKGIIWNGETVWCEKNAPNYTLQWQAQGAPTEAIFNIQEL